MTETRQRTFVDVRDRSGQLVRASARGLWRAVGIGPDHPSPLATLVPRTSPWVLPLLFMAVTAGIGVATYQALPGWYTSSWRMVVVLASAVLLMTAVYRPLLAWRLTWLALLYELMLAMTNFGPSAFPPLLLTGVQVLVVALVLLLAAASQPLSVTGWIWGLTAGLIWLAPLNWNGPLPERLRSSFGWWLTGPPWTMTEAPRQPFGLVWIHTEWLLVQIMVVVGMTGVVVTGQLLHRHLATREQLAEVEEHGLVLTERARIARELHDVVAHQLSMIAVRAESAPFRLGYRDGGLPEPVRIEFTEIAQGSREALTEMRRLLGVLRSEEQPSTAPQPTLAQLGDLVETARAAGAPVAVECEGSPTGLPPAVDVSAYRIVQEALTNAVRHSPGAPIRVALRRSEGVLEVTVRNGAPATGPGEGDRGTAGAEVEPGHGIRGMRERAITLGGLLRVGPTDSGGFEVHVTLPLHQEPT